MLIYHAIHPYVYQPLSFRPEFIGRSLFLPLARTSLEFGLWIRHFVNI